MKITFIKDCPPIVASGNSAYKAGTQADLRLGDQLINAGYARKGWEAVKREPEADTAVSQGVDYSKLGYRELQKLAKERGISANQSKDELIEALTNGDN